MKAFTIDNTPPPPQRKDKVLNWVKDISMTQEAKSCRQGKNMTGKSKSDEEGFGSNFKIKNNNNKKKTIVWSGSFEQCQILSHQLSVELEKAKYFSEISNLSESGGADMELKKLSPTCGNALEEDRRKEFELATDYIIRRTLQTLPDGFDVDHLCCLLKLCANVFPFIAMDRSGSHVSETALKSLGSSLCRGVPLNSPESYGEKPSTVRAEHLNIKISHPNGNESP